MISIRSTILLFIISTVWSYSAAQDDSVVDSSFLLPQPADCRFSGKFVQQKQLLGLEQTLLSEGLFFHDCEIGIIWKTLGPIKETLIMQKTGTAFTVRDGVSNQLNSTHSRQINKLILALIAGDNETLMSLFEIDNSNNERVVLLPTNNRIRRAIESISVSSSNNLDLPSMLVKMIDRNSQVTQIESTIIQVFGNNPHLLQANCLQTENIEIIDCGLLQAP